MAFVGITKGLINDTRARMNAMCSAELASVALSATDVEEMKSFMSTESMLDSLMWREHLNVKHVVPESWLVKVVKIDLYLRIKLENRSRKEHFPIDLNYTYFAPPNTSSYRPDVYFDMALSEDNVSPFLLKAHRFLVSADEIEQRWITTINSVQSFLENCKSLNEALKLWPEINVYIPESYTSRAMEQTKRAKKASRAMEVLQTINTQEVQAQAVIARLAGAKI